MERHVDSGERNRPVRGKRRTHEQTGAKERRSRRGQNSRKPTLEDEEARLGLQLLGRLDALVDNLAELLLDLVDGHDLGQLGEVDLLDLEEVENVPGDEIKDKWGREEDERRESTYVRA